MPRARNALRNDVPPLPAPPVTIREECCADGSPKAQRGRDMDEPRYPQISQHELPRRRSDVAQNAGRVRKTMPPARSAARATAQTMPTGAHGAARATAQNNATDAAESATLHKNYRRPWRPADALSDAP